MTVSPARPAAVRTVQLTRRFGAACAVDGIDLHVPPGSVFGFLGPNGAGKTTTMRMLLGLIRADAGHVELNGHRLDRERHLALAGVGSIIDAPALYPNLTGRETLNLAASVRGHSTSQVSPLLQLVDLESAADRTVRTYSLGMRQRLALAKALVGEPRLLILDEPTNGLDPAGIVQMRELIRELPSRFGTTVLLSSHQLSEIEQTADHCALLNRGTLIFQGTLAALLASARSRLVVETDNPLAAHAWFVGQGAAAEIRGDEVFAELEASPGERAAVTSALVGARIGISGLRTERPTLESLFLSMTGRVDAVAA